MLIDCLYFRVAGVTFENDNGTSRQKYIAKLHEYDPIGLKSFEYEGQTAFHVLDEQDHCIGNLPKEHIDFIMQHHEAGHKIVLYVNEILGLDEDGKRIDGYNLGVEVAVEVYDERPEEVKPSDAGSADQPAAAPQEKECKKTGRVLIGFGVFFALSFFVAFNPVMLVIAAVFLYFGIRRYKEYKASAK